MTDSILRNRALISSVVVALSLVGNLAFSNENVDLSQSPEVTAPSGITPPKQQGKIAIDYVNQPPMIPHSVEGAFYQVTLNNNGCLKCHSVQASRTTGAARISPTHFMDAEGRTLGKVAPRRYFCLQCHVPQVDAAPIVENTFKPVPGFGQ